MSGFAHRRRQGGYRPRLIRRASEPASIPEGENSTERRMNAKHPPRADSASGNDARTGSARRPAGADQLNRPTYLEHPKVASI